jgi:hypothetical protein
MKPSHVDTSALHPLRGTFRTLEYDLGAAIIVQAVRSRGDDWIGVTPKELSKACECFEANLRHMGLSPHFSATRVLFAQLDADGLVEVTKGPEGWRLGFTKSGLKAIYRSPWRRKASQKELFGA